MTIVTVLIDGTYYALDDSDNAVSTTVVTDGAPDFSTPVAVSAREARMIQRSVTWAEQAAEMLGLTTTRVHG
ncbi:MAG TPA: hypothetical protein VN803_08500 [Gemmatimonadales bacterium]|nr:hypothetical protein [Gemmatimonadales bacterium]